MKLSAVAAVVLASWLLSFFPTGAKAADSGLLKSPDLIVTNGTVLTMDDSRPRAEAVAVEDGLITAVGSTEKIAALRGPDTRILDLGGGTMIPGFIEAHAHLLYLGRSLQELKLATVSTWPQIVEMVANAARQAAPEQWIIGSGWHQEKLTQIGPSAVEGYPIHDDLSRVSPSNPVLLFHASGHAAIANTRAMELAGIAPDYQPPPGGRAVIDPDGRLTGVFLDAAITPIRRAAERAERAGDPRLREDRQRALVESAVDHALSRGITSFQDAGSSFATIDLLRQMERENRLRMRLWVMVGESNENLEKHLADYPAGDTGGGRLAVGSVKRFMDGALGSRTAWLLKPYDDAPEQTGLNVESPQLILETARIALRHGYQLSVHAIGDRAVQKTLDIYQLVFEDRGLPTDLRWRIEHAQHISGHDVDRFARLGVIASMQPVHCSSDGPWVKNRIGSRRADTGAYVWRKLIDSGAAVAVGTDAPVEDVDPIANFYAAVSCRLPDGSMASPDRRMSREEALRAYTLGNAYAAFEEDVKGSIAPGKYADFTVLSQDLTRVAEEKIRETRVLYTLVGGEIAYAAPAVVAAKTHRPAAGQN